MPTPPPPGFPFDALSDAVAFVSADGALAPCNRAMRELLAAAGGAAGPALTLTALGKHEDLCEQLLAGDGVTCGVGGARWSMRVVAGEQGRWLVATDTTERERATASVLAAARARSLADVAAAIVHDFTNLLNAGLGLGASVRPFVQDPADVRILDDLQRGTMQGAALARALARLVARDSDDRTLVEPTQLVDDAVAVVAKTAAQRGVALTVHRGTGLRAVRTVVPEATNALLQGLLTLLDHRPVSVTVTTSSVDAAPGGGRRRTCAQVRLEAHGLPAPVREELCGLVRQTPGFLVHLDRPEAAGLVGSLPVLRRLGGDLVAAVAGDAVRIDFLMPFARA